MVQKGTCKQAPLERTNRIALAHGPLQESVTDPWLSPNRRCIQAIIWNKTSDNLRKQWSINKCDSQGNEEPSNTVSSWQVSESIT